MPVTRFLLGASLLPLLVACGGDSAPGGAGDTSPPQAELSLEDIDLRIDVQSLPDPCALLPAQVATELLQVEAPQPESLVNEEAVARICSYTATVDGEQRNLFLKLSVFPRQLMSSAHDSRQQLIATASQLAGGLQPTAVLEDLGIISFVFDRDDATRVQVLTGMGGADPDTGEPVSELQLGYALGNAALDAEQRGELLLQQARRNMAQLQAGSAQ